ncbi:hypothetical protein B0H16DRAFT_1898367 [Mycena metata]|uniref:Uncharacterized protein n=1 Tax=Mycena metata TaxID=1033252 RepID=A0AAD7HB27_9AGAR|nr:hypothetical protein B0H16DRAFT_1898367 [Mycena metata]
MSAPNYNPFCVIGIYRAPDHSSREEFEKSMAKLGHDVKLLPAAQNNMLKLNIMYQNDKISKSIRGMRLSKAPTTVLVTGECETAEHLVEKQSPGYTARPIDRLQGMKRETCHGIFIFKVPSHVEVGEYHGKIESMVDKFLTLPVAREHIVKHTIWFQNDIMAQEFEETWRFPEAERTVAVMLECDTWDSMNQILTHEEIKTIIGDAMNDFGLHVESNCFSPDVETLVYKFFYQDKAHTLPGLIGSAARSSGSTNDASASVTLSRTSTLQSQLESSVPSIVRIIRRWAPSPRKRGTEEVSCKGLQLVFPLGENRHIGYPFGLHSHRSLPWDYYSEGDRFYLRSTTCSKTTSADSAICSKCDKIRTNDIFKNIVDRIAHGVNENTLLMYYPIGGLVTKIRRKNDQIQVLRLTKHNDTQKLASQTAALDRHKEFMMAVASGEVKRMAPLVTASINNHEGMDALLARMGRASADVFREGPRYNAKGFTADDRMVGLCALRLGGSRLADILHRALGLPGLTTLRKHTVIRPLRASPGLPTIAEVEENIDAYTVGEDLPTGPPRIVHRVVMLDEIAVERRARWDDKTNMILGACREHSANVPLEFGDMADAELFFKELQAGNVHLATEATVVAFGALSRDPHIYNPRPICISGTCKHEKGSEQAEFLQILNDAANNRKQHGNIEYRTVSFASDGEAKRGLALALEFMKFPLHESSPIYPLLKPLEFMNLRVGPDDITPDKDFRHVMKTTRGLLMRKAGINLLGFLITPAIVKKHLMAAGNSQAHVDQLLNPNDRQHVTLGYQLLRELWDLPDALPDDGPVFRSARRALQIFGRLGYHLVMPYICLSLSLREQLVHLSTAAHLLLILFATDGAGTKFMANQTFAKIDIPDSEFFLILLGTDRLEKLFGLIRTAVGTDANVDVYQLSTRASNLTEISIILTLRPHWDRGPRRIKLPAVINEKAEGIVPEGRETLAKLAAKKVDIFSPLGEYLLHMPDAPDAFTPDPVLLRPSPQETNDPAPESFYDPDGDIEDAIAIEKPLNPKHSPHVVVDGKKLSKASILSQLMQGRSVRLSTDRTRRVAGIPAFKSSSTNGLITSDNVPTLHISNPIAALVTCEDRIFLAVAQVNRIAFGSTDLDTLPLDLLADAGTKISFQILRLLPATEDDDPDGRHDWRWSLGGFESTCINVPGNLIQPLNPTISNRIPGKPTYLFTSDALLHVASGIQSQLASRDFDFIPEVPRSERFPYRHLGQACFVVELDDREYRGKLGGQGSFDCTKTLETEDPAIPDVDLSRLRRSETEDSESSTSNSLDSDNNQAPNSEDDSEMPQRGRRATRRVVLDSESEDEFGDDWMEYSGPTEAERAQLIPTLAEDDIDREIMNSAAPGLDHSTPARPPAPAAPNSPAPAVDGETVAASASNPPPAPPSAVPPPVVAVSAP